MVASPLVRFLVGQNALGRTRFARRRIIVMNERWIPVLAAVVGVLGGMGGALVGGSVANQGLEREYGDAHAG
jgi:hypothetical protein